MDVPSLVRRPLAAVLVLPFVLTACGWASDPAAKAPSPSASAAPKGERQETRSSPAATAMAGKPSDRRTMKLAESIGGAISPKSVVASGTGLVFAQNMMYRHSITVYSSAGRLVRT